jgi:hypothetical protein
VPRCRKGDAAEAAEAAARDAAILLADIDEHEAKRAALLRKRNAGGHSQEALAALVEELRLETVALVSAAVETVKLVHSR